MLRRSGPQPTAIAPSLLSVLRHGSRLPMRAAVALFILPLGACDGGVLDPKGPVGAAQRTILLNSLAIMLAIVIPTIAATLGFAWWYRDSNPRARYRPDFVYS